MNRHLWLAVLLASAVALPASARTIEAFADMDGPTVIPAADTDATAFAELTVDSRTGAYDFTMTATGIDIVEIADSRAGGLHVHEGVAGTNGGIVVNLFDDFKTIAATPGTFVWTAAGNVEDGELSAAAFADALLSGGLYVQAHSEEFLPGVMRGQLSEVPVPAAALLLASGALGLLGLRRRQRA